MKQEIFSGDLLSRGHEISALISQYFRNLKLYKMRLVTTQLTLFGDHPNSDQLELFEKAMNADMNMQKEFKFRHPKAGSYWIHFAVKPKGNRRKGRFIQT